MAKLSTKPPSGMRDFLPQDVMRRRHVIEIVRGIYESHGFVPVETPTIENLSTLLGKYGEEGDSLIFRVLHRRDALRRAVDAAHAEQRPANEAELSELGLRYDLTVPLARLVAEYADLPRFFKRYQIQPVWRADRPGRGRFREFYQCDVDITGTTSLVAEAEVCTAVARALKALGFAEFEVSLNHRELLRSLIQGAGIPLNLETTALVALDKLDKIGVEGVASELAERGVPSQAASTLLGWVSEASSDTQAELARLSALPLGERGTQAIAALTELLELLDGDLAASHVRVRIALARGLSYYTGAIFEIVVPDLAGSLGGGGRYDGLVGMFGKRDVPAVGFSLGLERILVVMQERNMFPASLRSGPEILICWTDDVSARQALACAAALRAQGLSCEPYPEPAKLGKQLQYASSIGATYAAIVAGDEWARGQVALKHLGRGEQATVALDAVAAHLASVVN